MSWLTDAGRALAGSIPGGAQAYDALSTKEGRSAALEEAMARLNGQASGALAGAAAGAGAVVASQNARSSAAANVGVPLMLAVVGVGLVLIWSGRK